MNMIKINCINNKVVKNFIFVFCYEINYVKINVYICIIYILID